MTAALAISETSSQLGAIAPSAPPAVLARLAGIGKIYGTGEHAVVTLIEGPSGSGKTTLISILGLLLTPTAGEVCIEGRNVAGLGERELPALRARNFGFVFQGFN